ncbi:D-alanyl-D-alanine dipeptidase [Marinomonas polaris DSM 16579]|uniref:D-alanyl-D-alanine dipeptidase n=1 Tax=Marinomonas polaris DSM 16579 TaxID=1122206 RepID=A0A1M5CUH9_9GAMM|nr:M15 family metallopeptidase [Marinomonas polaris]SHF58379.1 D-alanyl-D-alanine dipeptidase [Marinomonas polaris DSM 16579]
MSSYRPPNQIPPSNDFSWDNYRQITIEDNGEVLIPLSTSNRLVTYPFYAKMGIANAIPECFVRESVFDKLHQVTKLMPSGVRLVVLDGWRPFSVQQYLFDTLINILKKSFPNHAESYLHEKAKSLVSPPSTDVKAPSPHLTGGSVDVTLCDEMGRFLDMGTHFDEASQYSWTDALETPSWNNKGPQENRRILYNAMIEVGFTNLPSEWWHYDFGNQLWAYRTGSKKAIYGVTRPRDILKQWESEIIDNGFI